MIRFCSVDFFFDYKEDMHTVQTNRDPPLYMHTHTRAGSLLSCVFSYLPFFSKNLLPKVDFGFEVLADEDRSIF